MILAAGLAVPALARQNPPPPPSGIVIHLFGPDSITSKILPTAPAASAPAAPAPAAPVASMAGGAVMAPAPQAAAAPAYQAPSLHDVLRQMFITGDPDQKTGQDLAPGRTAERY
jgi:hypothetical protein